jgi:hypothetical protein
LPPVEGDWFIPGSALQNNAKVIQTYANTTAQYCKTLTRIFVDGFEDRYTLP